MGDKLDHLEDRLKDAREGYEEHYNPKPPADKNISDGARAGIELVGAVLGGGLIGWGLDKLFNTSPALFLTFLLLGIATGFYNVYRITAGMGMGVGARMLHNGKKDAKEAQENKDNKR